MIIDADFFNGLADMEEHFPGYCWSENSVLLLVDINIALYPTYARFE